MTTRTIRWLALLLSSASILPGCGGSPVRLGDDVEAPDGTELGYRKLLHPHVNEQPFTRSLGGVSVPDGMTEVVIRAHDSVHGWGAPYALTLPGDG